MFTLLNVYIFTHNIHVYEYLYSNVRTNEYEEVFESLHFSTVYRADICRWGMVIIKILKIEISDGIICK